MVKELTRPGTPLRRGTAPETAWAFFNGAFVPLRDANACLAAFGESRPTIPVFLKVSPPDNGCAK